MLRRSAVPETSMRSTACSEVVRRLKNHCVQSDKSEVEECLITYMDNLEGMGFDLEWRIEVLKEAVKKYSRIMFLVESGKTDRNRLEE